MGPNALSGAALACLDAASTGWVACGDRSQSARRVVEELPEDVGVLGLPGGVRFAGGLEGVERPADSGVVAQVHLCQARPMKSPTRVARALGPLLQRLAVADRL
ncbi:hypothetical protein SAFG77S_04575 [Streptomyces afghaniensis]